MRNPKHVALLGSSFAAGPGIDPIVDKAAGRSAKNYGHLVADRFGARLTDASVSGATIDTLLRNRQRIRFTTYPPQVSLIAADTDLALITAGGNDLGYIGAMMKLSLAGALRGRRIVGTLVRRLPRPAPPVVTDADSERAAAGLAEVVAAVRLRAPAARVLLVDYPTLIGPSTRPGPDLPVTPNELQILRGVGDRVAAAFRVAAERSGAELVEISVAGRRHAVGSTEPWVNGMLHRDGDGERFHPNAAGMRAIADLVIARLAAA